MPSYYPTAADALIDLDHSMRTVGKEPRGPFDTTDEAILKLATRFAEQGTGFRFRALFEAWPIMRIVQELDDLKPRS